MNQTILFRFAIIINSIILYIYGCVTFQDDSNEQCSELETSDEENKSILQCIIQDPTAKMDSTKCDMKKFDVINVSMSNLEEMEKFFLDNNETMVTFLQLFKNESHLTTQLIIELEDILSTSNSVDLAINKQWITKHFDHLTSDNLRIDIHMKANDWSEVNLTIHADVNDIPKSKTIELYLEKSDHHMLCTLYVTPSALYHSTYMKSLCRDYVIFVDHHGNAVPWPATESSIVKRTFTIRNTIDQKGESSSGFWAYILSPIFIIIIILGIIIYCIMKKNRKTSIPKSYSQSITTAPAYTYNVPMYHSPAYNQK